MDSASVSPDNKESKERLKAAWDDLIAELQLARDAIDNPAFFPPEASDRNLAEGYRYLAGFMHHAVERAFHEDADFPTFRNGLSVYNKSTIDNADAIYFYAPIDGKKHYRVHGNIADHRHWRGEARAESGHWLLNTSSLKFTVDRCLATQVI